MRDIEHIYEPTPLQCGQAVLAMLTAKSVGEIITLCGTERETTLFQMKDVLNRCGFKVLTERTSVNSVDELPETALLSLETPHCWHWSLWHSGRVYDPEYGILTDFPPSSRKYFWKIQFPL